MRHKKKGNHLSRTTAHKKALMRNMAAQVLEHKEIKTTTAKAKELRGYVERLVTYGKKGSLHHRRLAFKFLQNKEAVKDLFNDVAPTFDTREGGYTRIIKLGNRRGDGAPMSILQLVGFEKTASKSKPKPAKKEKKKDKDETKEVEAKAAETKVEEPIVEKSEEVIDDGGVVEAEQLTAETESEEVKESPETETKAEAEKHDDETESKEEAKA